MQHDGYYGSTSLISNIMGTNEITFNINLQSPLWKYQFSENVQREYHFPRVTLMELPSSQGKHQIL
jgi:hypothetical protein